MSHFSAMVHNIKSLDVEVTHTFTETRPEGYYVTTLRFDDTTDGTGEITFFSDKQLPTFSHVTIRTHDARESRREGLALN